MWETEVNTVVQNDFETVTKHYITDYLSMANRDIMVTEDGSWIGRYVYDYMGKRVSEAYSYADGTERNAPGATNAVNSIGEYGENPSSDIADGKIQKVWFRNNLTGSSLIAVDKNGAVVAHMIYDPWGKPLVETYVDGNFSGIDNLNNYSSYTWDETLGLYFAQNRFYDANTHSFTQEDPAKSGGNWYAYCDGNPLTRTDVWGLVQISSMPENQTKILIWLCSSEYNWKTEQDTIIQIALDYLGYLDEFENKLVFDGKISSHFVAALSLFQSDYNKRHAAGIIVSGLPSAETWKALRIAIYNNEKAIPLSEYYIINKPIKPAPKLGDDDFIGSAGGHVYAQIHDIQTWLNALGYTNDKGQALGVDGDYGPSSTQAVAKFQKANGLSVTGDLNAATYNLIQKKYNEYLASKTIPSPTNPPASGMTPTTPIYNPSLDCDTGGVGNPTIKAYVANAKANWSFEGSSQIAKDNMVTIQINVWLISNGSKITGTRWVEVYKGISAQVTQIFAEIYADSTKFPIKAVGGFRWSSGDFKDGKIYYEAHPTGTGIDINPDENYSPGVYSGIWKPYDNPYSMPSDGIVVKTFKKYGWGWGGDWNSSKDYMHFSVTAM